MRCSEREDHKMCTKTEEETKGTSAKIPGSKCIYCIKIAIYEFMESTVYFLEIIVTILVYNLTLTKSL